MNIQHSPKTTSDIDQQFDKVDHAIADIKQSTRQDLQPPVFGEQHRHAVISCVDGLVDTLSQKVMAIRVALDRIEQHMLQSAAKSKVSMENHVETCQRLNAELSHLMDFTRDLEHDTDKLRE